MSVSHAILALLSGGPQSGYGIKKLLSDVDSLPWSGNSNTVYPALLELERGGLVERDETAPGERPVRRRYAITDAGREALREWQLGEAGLPSARSPIVARLAGADALSLDEVEQMLLAYEEDLRLQVLGLEERARRGEGPSTGSARQREIWRHIAAHRVAHLRAEREWLLTLQWALARMPAREEPGE